MQVGAVSLLILIREGCEGWSIIVDEVLEGVERLLTTKKGVLSDFSNLERVSAGVFLERLGAGGKTDPKHHRQVRVTTEMFCENSRLAYTTALY